MFVVLNGPQNQNVLLLASVAVGLNDATRRLADIEACMPADSTAVTRAREEARRFADRLRELCKDYDRLFPEE